MAMMKDGNGHREVNHGAHQLRLLEGGKGGTLDPTPDPQTRQHVDESNDACAARRILAAVELVMGTDPREVAALAMLPPETLQAVVRARAFQRVLEVERSV
jgi:hypothetical protein